MGQEERTACPLCDGSGPPPAYIKYKDCKEDGIIMTVEKASWDNKYQQRRKKKKKHFVEAEWKGQIITKWNSYMLNTARKWQLREERKKEISWTHWNNFLSRYNFLECYQKLTIYELCHGEYFTSLQVKM